MINFIGWYGRQNVGDVAFEHAVRKLWPELEVRFTEKPLPQADRYILGPGDVIKPYYLNALRDKPFSILGAGLGYESELQLLKDMNVEEMRLRNYEDVAIALQAGFHQAAYTPDLAFALERPDRVAPIQPKKRAVVILSDAVNASYVNVDQAKVHYAEYLKWELAKALSDLGQWYNFEFLPFSEEKNDFDLRCHLDVVNRMSSNQSVKMVHKHVPSVPQALQIISDADLVITMKFHGVIFSTLCHTPFVNIGVTRKTSLFCREHSLSALAVPAYGFTVESFMKAVKVAEMDLIPLKLLQIAKKKRETLSALSL